MKRTYREEYQHWLDSPALNEKEWQELDSIKNDDKEIESRFYAPLEFGTAGLRGTMKVGLHNMNVHVIRQTTQAFANVIARDGEQAKQKGIVICFDCRINSDVFAREAACVMAANGIHVRLFQSLHPTPELSFAVRYYRTTAGLNITASHNPKEYNGYKVYWSDGAQLPPQHAQAIAAEREKLDIFNGFSSMDYEEAVQKGIIELLDESTDEAFLKEVLGQAVDRDIVAKVADDFKIVYTPFHGCGYKLVPEALKRLGIKHLYPVPEQMVIDGTFPTVDSPNPENPEGFALAIDLARKVDSDLIIGTDPDSDRIGVLHLGHMVETGTTDEIFANPVHPYTKSLLSAVPLPNPEVEKRRRSVAYDRVKEGVDYSAGTVHQVEGTHTVLATDEEFARWTA